MRRLPDCLGGGEVEAKGGDPPPIPESRASAGSAVGAFGVAIVAIGGLAWGMQMVSGGPGVSGSSPTDGILVTLIALLAAGAFAFKVKDAGWVERAWLHFFSTIFVTTGSVAGRVLIYAGLLLGGLFLTSLGVGVFGLALLLVGGFLARVLLSVFLKRLGKTLTPD